jgi:hypothetical protein
MKKSITIRRFTAGSSFKIVAIGVSISVIAFAALMGVFVLFGAQTVHWNRHAITGIAGLLASPFIGVFLAVFFSLFGWLGFIFSFWLFSRFGSLTVEYISDEPPNKSPEPTPVGAVSPPSRAESQFRRGSAFYVRQHSVIKNYE